MAVSLSQIDVLFWKWCAPQGAPHWVILENTACQMPLVDEKRGK